jgi:hypothetical protein
LIIKIPEGQSASLTDVQISISDEAEFQDLLGNIDGFYISYLFSNRMQSTSGGLNVSTIIRDYYEDLPNRKAFRFSTFARLVGLGNLNRQTNSFTGGEHWFNKGSWFGGTNNFSNEEEWVNYYATQIVQSAMQFILATDKNVFAAKRAEREIESSKILLRRFLNGLKDTIRLEP